MGKKRPYWIKNIRQLIHWHYAKLITESIYGTRDDYPLVMNEYKKLESGEKNMSSLLRQNKQMLDMEKKCDYCGSMTNIQLDHIIPISKGGPDSLDNLVYSCRKCNISKGNKSLVQWYGEDFSYKIPKFVFAKFLKLIYLAYEQSGNLNSDEYFKTVNPDTKDLEIIFQLNIR